MGDFSADRRVESLSVRARAAESLGAARTQLVDDWIQPAVGEVPIGFGPPRPAAIDSLEVTLTLLSLAPSTPGRATRGPGNLALTVQHLLTTAGSTPAEADDALVTLAFAALEAGYPDLERFAPASETWRSLAVPARPALLIRQLIERPRVPRDTPLVREVVTRWTSRRPLAGQVVGPDAVPIAGACIELEGSTVATYSDSRGEFRFAAVPAGASRPRLAVTAKGTRFVVRADPTVTVPLIIQVPLPES